MNKTVDRKGNAVKEGDSVIVISIHPSVIEPLADDEKEKVVSMEGEVLVVYEVDEYGQAWVEKEWKITPSEIESHSLGLAPEEMERISTEGS